MTKWYSAIKSPNNFFNTLTHHPKSGETGEGNVIFSVDLQKMNRKPELIIFKFRS
jgi:hypothetical protein